MKENRSFLEKNNPIVNALDLTLTCAPIYELPSDISKMENKMNLSTKLYQCHQIQII